MNADRLQSVLAEALAQSTPGQRKAYLDQACGDDADLRRRVEALLQADAAIPPGATRDDEPSSSIAAVAAPPLSESPGARIGPYKLLQRLGEGGMGAVFMAEQEKPVQRRVALKVIRAGMDTAHVLARFEAERQALAMMDHPNIAKVLDAGATDNGRPIAHALASQQQAMEALRATTDDVMEQLIGGKPALGPAEKAFLETTLKRWQAFADAAGEGEQARAIRAEGVYRVAKLREKLGQRDEAVLGYREAITLRRKLVDDFPGVPQHRQDLALTHAELSHVLADLGKQQEREMALRQALTLREKLAVDFPDEPEYRFDEANSDYDLGWLLSSQGKDAEAESPFRRAQALYDQRMVASPAVAKYRRGMAATQSGLGYVLTAHRKFAPAEAAFRQAIALLEKLVEEFPAVPDYRDQLAISHNNLGFAFEQQDKTREYEASVRAALAIKEKLAADFPAVPDYRNSLALLYNNLGDMLCVLGKREGETVLRQGLAIAEKLVAEFPTVPEHRIVLGQLQLNFGRTFLKLSKDPEKALPWYDKAIATEEEALRRGGSIARARMSLRWAREHRAGALGDLQRHTEALEEYDKAVELLPERGRPYGRSNRAVGLVKAGQVAAAIKEAEELAKNADVAVLYNAACVYALASKPTKTNPISPEQQAKHAERAIALLRQALAKGYSSVNEMKKDDDLKPLRQRDDFQKLLREMQK